LKSIVAQHENLAAKGILGVTVSLRFIFSFPLNNNNPRNFFTEQSFDKFQRFCYEIHYHNRLGKYSNSFLNYHYFSKSGLFEQFYELGTTHFQVFFL